MSGRIIIKKRYQEDESDSLRAYPGEIFLSSPVQKTMEYGNKGMSGRIPSIMTKYVKNIPLTALNPVVAELKTK